jgi:hypothetical protein
LWIWKCYNALGGLKKTANNLRITEIRSQYQIRWEVDYEQRRAGLGKEWDDLDKLYLRFRAAGLTLQATLGQVLVAIYLHPLCLAALNRGEWSASLASRFAAREGALILIAW